VLDRMFGGLASFAADQEESAEGEAGAVHAPESTLRKLCR
jgi:hypothetical protein